MCFAFLKAFGSQTATNTRAASPAHSSVSADARGLGPPSEERDSKRSRAGGRPRFSRRRSEDARRSVSARRPHSQSRSASSAPRALSGFKFPYPRPQIQEQPSPPSSWPSSNCPKQMHFLPALETFSLFAKRRG